MQATAWASLEPLPYVLPLKEVVIDLEGDSRDSVRLGGQDSGGVCTSW